MGPLRVSFHLLPVKMLSALRIHLITIAYVKFFPFITPLLLSPVFSGISLCCISQITLLFNVLYSYDSTVKRSKAFYFIHLYFMLFSLDCKEGFLSYYEFVIENLPKTVPFLRFLLHLPPTLHRVLPYNIPLYAPKASHSSHGLIYQEAPCI